METTIRLRDGAWYINGFGIAGNPDDGYTVWREDEGMDMGFALAYDMHCESFGYDTVYDEMRHSWL